MSRPPRIDLPGALHHVSLRALERSPLFRDDGDRERFLVELGRTAAERGWLVHAYALLGSSLELLLETPVPNLSDGMRALGGRYAQAFNRRYGRSGPLFDGRFRSLLVDPEGSFLEAARSVALAPVRATTIGGHHPNAVRLAAAPHKRNLAAVRGPRRLPIVALIVGQPERIAAIGIDGQQLIIGYVRYTSIHQRNIIAFHFGGFKG